MPRCVRAAALVLLLVGCGRVPSGLKRASQPALVVQRMGATNLAVRYNRPSARGRTLFGGIVPWDSVWCPGADEGTRLTVSSAIFVGGRRLPEGAYTLWLIPRASGPWTLIFSRKSRAYHVPYPGAAHDALRIPVAPGRGAYVETLSWGFPVATKKRAVLELAWGDVVVDVPIEHR
jgi:hypothetical protein